MLLGVLLLAILGQMQAGPRGVAGVFMLAFGCGFSVVGLAVITQFVTGSLPPGANGRSIFIAITMLVFKLPLTILCLWLAWTLLRGAILPFFGTLGLVYSATVWNLVSAPQDAESR